MNRGLVWLGPALVAALLTACGGDDDAYSPPPATTAATATASTPVTPPAAAAAEQAPVQVREAAKVGNVLATPAGLTLYTFANDATNSGKSSCTGTCAANWPPLTTTAAALAAPAGIPGEFKVIQRDDGSRQVTFNGKPLYRYAGDKAPGEATGEGVGGVWFAAKVGGPSATAPSATAASGADAYSY